MSSDVSGGDRGSLGVGSPRVVFFGRVLSVECQRCGEFTATTAGHSVCAQLACPIAMREFHRRNRKRTTGGAGVRVPVGMPILPHGAPLATSVPELAVG